MSLKIQPDNLILDDADTPSSIDFTMENDGKTDVRFKFRCPTTNVLKVSEPSGSISTSKAKKLQLTYFPEKNTSGDGQNLMIQLKYIPIEDGMADSDELFTSHKEKEQTRILSVTFQDKLRDHLFKSEVMDPGNKNKDKWWKKLF